MQTHGLNEIDKKIVEEGRKETREAFEEHDDIIRRMNIHLYGFDISKLSYKKQELVKQQAERRRELEEMKERMNPKPKPVLTKEQELESRRVALLSAKFEKIGGGKSLKDVTNAELEQQLQVLREIIGDKGV